MLTALALDRLDGCVAVLAFNEVGGRKETPKGSKRIRLVLLRQGRQVGLKIGAAGALSRSADEPEALSGDEQSVGHTVAGKGLTQPVHGIGFAATDIQVFVPLPAVGKKQGRFSCLLGLCAPIKAMDTVLTSSQVKGQDIAKQGADEPFAGSRYIP